MAVWRRRRPPGLALESGERVLAHATTPDGPAVATDRRLLFPTADGTAAVAWDDVDRATWSGEEGLLVVVETPPLGARRREHRLRIDDGRTFLDVVREQVNASIVISRYLPIEPGRGVQVIGRRRPDQTLRWVVRPDAGLDVDAPGTRQRIAAAVAEVRAEVD
ncbi:MAG: hypothetical protein ICV70_04555 [Jiangellaceae bacterium]|nr:hypothetical protein [Jiangellaceae bacterium]